LVMAVPIEADAFRKILPDEFYHRFLTQRVRPDGRSLSKTRRVNITTGNISSADGSAMVRLGETTTVIAAVRADVAKPNEGQPTVGSLTVAVEAPPVCSSRYRPGKSPPDAVCATQLLNRILTSVGAVDLQRLTVAGSDGLVWALSVDVYCVNHDGNLIDAALLATLAALASVQLPQVVLCEDGDVRVDASSAPACLSLTRIPLSFSFALLQDELLADPTSEEEELASAVLTVALDDTGRVCATHKAGGAPLSHAQCEQCIDLALQGSAKLLSALHIAAPSTRNI